MVLDWYRKQGKNSDFIQTIWSRSPYSDVEQEDATQLQ